MAAQAGRDGAAPEREKDVELGESERQLLLPAQPRVVEDLQEQAAAPGVAEDVRQAAADAERQPSQAGGEAGPGPGPSSDRQRELEMQPQAHARTQQQRDAEEEQEEEPVGREAAPTAPAPQPPAPAALDPPRPPPAPWDFLFWNPGQQRVHAWDKLLSLSNTLSFLVLLFLNVLVNSGQLWPTIKQADARHSPVCTPAG